MMKLMLKGKNFVDGKGVQEFVKFQNKDTILEEKFEFYVETTDDRTSFYMFAKDELVSYPFTVTYNIYDTFENVDEIIDKVCESMVSDYRKCVLEAGTKHPVLCRWKAEREFKRDENKALEISARKKMSNALFNESEYLSNKMYAKMLNRVAKAICSDTKITHRFTRI